MLAYIEFHSWMKRQHNEFARRVTRKSNSTWTMCDADDKWHARERTLDSTLQRHNRHRGVVIFPEQHVMFEENGVALTKVDLCCRNDLALHLTCAQTKMDLRHV